jgi:hypothetical protein
MTALASSVQVLAPMLLYSHGYPSGASLLAAGTAGRGETSTRRHASGCSCSGQQFFPWSQLQHCRSIVRRGYGGAGNFAGDVTETRRSNSSWLQHGAGRRTRRQSGGIAAGLLSIKDKRKRSAFKDLGRPFQVPLLHDLSAFRRCPQEHELDAYNQVTARCRACHFSRLNCSFKLLWLIDGFMYSGQLTARAFAGVQQC